MGLLIVEDEEAVRSLLANFLRDEGYWVAEASSAADAKRLLASEPGIDLLVTDVRMPGESGIQLARYVRQNYPDIGVLIASGNVTDGELGGEPFIMKPFSLGQLAAKIGDLLREKR